MFFQTVYVGGDVDPNWDYVLRGSCFGFRVIDDTCGSRYSMANYGSITKGNVGIEMGSRLQLEIDEEFLTVVDKACMCIHGLGAVPKGHDDFRAILDCSSPDGACIKDYTKGCWANFSGVSHGANTGGRLSGHGRYQ